ncbi:MAG: hypothetical protein H7Y43_15475 [Akkermansiaceae bacterium]|nr:hypothetical protein [Verrucomicrobiales bacterium]
MNEKKKQTYNASIAAMPALKQVMGDIPSPDGEPRQAAPLRTSGADRLELQTRSALNKLFGHFQEKK